MNKKIFAALLTAALTFGGENLTFANPFEDVPKNHWAYDSVEKLASAGVIEGYGDGTFLGNRNITRYESSRKKSDRREQI